jgi:hypothetical protein
MVAGFRDTRGLTFGHRVDRTNLAHPVPPRPRRQQYRNPLLPDVIGAAVLQLSVQ